MKKGQASIIAWVLLIGFAVTLAIFVGRWSLQQAEESTERVETMIIGDVQCADIAISGRCDGSVTNRGTLTIHELRLSGVGKSVIEKEINLKPKDTIYNVFSPTGKVKIMPIIHLDNKRIGCNNKEITLNCEA